MIGKKALFDSNIIIYLSKREISFSHIDQFDDHYIIDDFRKIEAPISNTFD